MNEFELNNYFDKSLIDTDLIINDDIKQMDNNFLDLYGPYDGFIKGILFKNLYLPYKDYEPAKLLPNNEYEEDLLNLNQKTSSELAWGMSQSFGGEEEKEEDEGKNEIIGLDDYIDNNNCFFCNAICRSNFLEIFFFDYKIFLLIELYYLLFDYFYKNINYALNYLW